MRAPNAASAIAPTVNSGLSVAAPSVVTVAATGAAVVVVVGAVGGVTGGVTGAGTGAGVVVTGPGTGAGTGAGVVVTGAGTGAGVVTVATAALTPVTVALANVDDAPWSDVRKAPVDTAVESESPMDVATSAATPELTTVIVKPRVTEVDWSSRRRPATAAHVMPEMSSGVTVNAVMDAMIAVFTAACASAV